MTEPSRRVQRAAHLLADAHDARIDARVAALQDQIDGLRRDFTDFLAGLSERSHYS